MNEEVKPGSQGKLTLAMINELRGLLRKAKEYADSVGSLESKSPDELAVIDTKLPFEALGALEACAPMLLDAAEIGVQWQENSSLEKWFPITAEEIAKLKQGVQWLTTAKAELEREINELMEYHEEEVARIFSIQQQHGTAVVAFRVDRQQFLHLPPGRLEEKVSEVTQMTLETLLAGTPAREVFDRLTRERVWQRVNQPGKAVLNA